MKKEDLLEKFKDYDEIINSSVEMIEPNLPVKIYEGNYIIKNDETEISIVGQIQYDWFPHSGANFSGEILDKSADMYKSVYKLNTFKIIIDGLEFGEGFITKTNYTDKIFVKGTLSQQVIIGDKSIAVNKLKFSVPNMREFHGLVVKKITGERFTTASNRLKLENDKYIILIDKDINYKERRESLDEKGGYLLLYNGEITSKKGSLTYEETKDIFHCLDNFLTFINGRRTSAIFIHGLYEDEIIWKDFTDYQVDIYNFAPSWPEIHSIIGLNELFQKFSEIWKDKDDRQFLSSAIHWYVEANNNSGFSEGAIIMAQTALELIYNWFIIENKKLIIGKDSENINAANKIRLLISQLNIDYSVPKKFTFLQQFIDDNSYMIDAPDAVVQIRNAIVHSQEEKRKKLSEINYKAKYQALQLCIWYIEMSLLAVLDYNGKYCNRCSIELYTSKTVENVPWKK